MGDVFDLSESGTSLSVNLAPGDSERVRAARRAGAGLGRMLGNGRSSLAASTDGSRKGETCATYKLQSRVPKQRCRGNERRG